MSKLRRAIQRFKAKKRALRLIMEIWKWHDEHFGEWRFDDQRSKFTAEVYEFIAAMQDYTGSNNNPKKLHAVYKELADILISGLSLLKYYQGYSTVSYKFEIVRKRTYGKDGQHKA